MQSGKAQVSCLRELDRILHGIAVADLADQDDVRCLAQRVLECVVPGLRIDANFALGNHAALVRMHVLDRVLDGHDVAARVLVAVADHRGERRRLTRAGAADDDHDAALVHDDVLEDGRQLQILERRDLRRNRTQHGAHVALLDKRTDAETADALRRDREVTLLGRVELLDLFVVHDGTHHHRGLVCGQRCIGGLVDRAVDLDGRRESARDEQVRAVTLHHFAQQVLCKAYSLLAFHLPISSPGRRTA